MVLDGQRPSKTERPIEAEPTLSPAPYPFAVALRCVDWPAKISLALPNFGSNPSADQIIGASPKFGLALQGKKKQSAP